jgi:predicted nucleic acid-binding protein
VIYLDTSFLTPLFREEAVSGKVDGFLATHADSTFAVSQWTRVEFASVVARDVRTKKLTGPLAMTLIEEFDALVSRSLHLWQPRAADFDLARRFVADFATKLRGPDALHLAIARNNGAEELLTLDEDLLFAARRLKIKAGRGIRL